MPATTALSKSYNITALNLYNVVRQRMNVQDYMKKIGITTLTNNDYAQIGLGIGGTDYGVTVNQLTSAFATYANGGVHASTYMIDKITDPSGKVVYQHKQKRTRVVSKATSYIMKHMMNAVVDSGTAASLNSYLSFSTKNLMGKTGESNNERDSWFIGSTPGVSLGAWMGYDNNYRHSFNLASSATRTEIHYWAQQMNAIYKLIPNRMRVNESMAKPATVKSVAVNSMTGMPNGSVSYNGSTIKTSGNTVTSMYNDWTRAVSPASSGSAGPQQTTSSSGTSWAAPATVTARRLRATKPWTTCSRLATTPPMATPRARTGPKRPAPPAARHLAARPRAPHRA